MNTPGVGLVDWSGVGEDVKRAGKDAATLNDLIFLINKISKTD